MPKEKIAIVSILKPVDDVRSYHKMAKSLSKHGNLQIHLIGYPSQNLPNEESSIFFHTSRTFANLSLDRLLARFRAFLILLKIKPDWLIVNTHELLFMGVFLKTILRCKIIYDVQENYGLNLRCQNNYSRVIKKSLAAWVEFKQKVTRHFLDHVILAEQCYIDEMPIFHEATVLENKSILIREKKKSQTPRILFSGTLTQSNGVLRALDIMTKLHHINRNWEFIMIGHCPQEVIWKKLKSADYSFIQMNVSRSPIPFDQISLEIQLATLGLVTYQINPSNQYCMPTKVYDYAAVGLPMLYDRESHWGNWIKQNADGIDVTFVYEDPEKLFDRITELTHKKQTLSNESSYLWETEEPKLFNIFGEPSFNN